MQYKYNTSDNKKFLTFIFTDFLLVSIENKFSISKSTLMVQSVYQRMNPGKKHVLKYTTVSGIDGFDGTRKEAEKPVVKAIN